MHRILVGLLAVVGLCGWVAVASAEDAKPSATLELSGKSVGVGVGFTWETGKLTYNGKTYDVAVDGIDVGDVGVAMISASGKVYNLKKVEDFSGNYTAAGAGAAVAGGGGAAIMQNQNGVRVELLSTSQGVKLALGPGGVNMRIKQ